ncbi:ANTAR domain-containing protein [Aeromicrobium sp.]|uniref:ANTAR domain-containing protein n=1 Tax=Aeromicrobium sp. TaxID=1871063 RepID=UPI0019CBAC18|nr:ANTAR domain-containing protein [Aeromicrobium sp.]
MLSPSTASRPRSRSRSTHARTFIGQAQGILMGRYGIGAEQAFDYLRRRSQQEQVKLSDVAHNIIGDQDDKNAAQSSDD